MRSSNSLSTIPATLKRFGLDWFILALLGMILLAYLFPGPGATEGTASLDSIAGYGVSLIFFFYGLRLNGAELKSGLSNWRLHLIIQAATFLLFPLIVWVIIMLLQGDGQEYTYLWIGVFFLAALPSTVSSSVVMVSIAQGNIPAAIFNASISSLLGVFITPLWMGLMMQQTTSSDLNLGSVVGKLALQVFLPVLLGILLNPTKMGAFAARHRQTLKYFDQSIILLIVYTSFSESFQRNMFEGYAASDLFMLGGGLLALFAVIIMLMVGLSIISKFSREDKITLLFCGSKKSLVHGSVIAKVLFPGSIAGVVLLPVMIYHAIQLVIASILAQKFAQQKKL